MAKMKTRDLEALLKRLQASATGSENRSINGHRAQLMRRYLARPYGDEVDGRSKIVDTTIRDTIEAIKPELMDIFTGGDRVVDFAPIGDEDIKGAREETDVCNHVLMEQNEGFMVLYCWFTDALFQKVGYIKRFWDDRTRVEVEEYDGLTPEEAAAVLHELQATSDKVEFLEQSGGIDDETGQVEPLYLKIRRTSTEKRYSVVNVPPEEVLIHPLWKHVTLARCPYIAHKLPATVSDLIEMGFDRKQVEDMPTYDRRLEAEEATARHADQDFTESGWNDANPAMREVLVYENYVLADQDGDGIAEQLQVFTDSSGTILKRNRKLAIEQVTDAPFEALCPYPIPHRHFGMSVAELVEDLQKIKTVLSRQFIDNIVGSNNPDIVVDDDQATHETYQDLAETGLGRVIRAPGGSNSVGPLPVPQTAGQSLAAIEYVDNLKEERSGVTRHSQGIDADALAPLAENTVSSLLTAAQKKILLIARVFAETGFKSLFVNMHRDLRAGPVKEMALQLNNEWVAVNPRKWRGRTDIRVSVGLGTGDKQTQLGLLTRILAEQKEALAHGVVGYEHIHHTYERFLDLAGFKGIGNFFPTPEDVQEQAASRTEQPDPTLVALTMQRDIESMKNATKEKELQIKQLDIMMRDDRERDIAAAKIEENAEMARDASIV